MERKAVAIHQGLYSLPVIKNEVFWLVLMIIGLGFYKEIISKIHGFGSMDPVFIHCKTKFGWYF